MQTLTATTVNRHMAVCPKCWRTFCCCRAGHIIVDYTMVDILRLLNKKGYKTLYHCGGHIKAREPLFVYVKFSRQVILPDTNKLPTGAGWGYDAYHNQIEYYNSDLDLNEDDKIKLLSQKHDELLQWAKALPKR